MGRQRSTENQRTLPKKELNEMEANNLPESTQKLVIRMLEKLSEQLQRHEKEQRILKNNSQK